MAKTVHNIRIGTCPGKIDKALYRERCMVEVRQIFYKHQQVSKSIKIKRKYINDILGIILEVKTGICPENMNKPLYEGRYVGARQTSKELLYKVLQ